MLICAFVFVPQSTHVFREHGVLTEPREPPFTQCNNLVIEAFCIGIPEWRSQDWEYRVTLLQPDRSLGISILCEALVRPMSLLGLSPLSAL